MKNKLKVLFIAPTRSQYAGDNLSLEQLILGLKKYNVEILVITLSIESASVYQKVEVSCKILESPKFKFTAIRWPANTIKNILFYPIYHLRDLWRFRRTTNAIKKIALEFQPDIIHSNTSAVVAGHIVSKKLNVAHVWHVREFLDLDFKMKLFFSKKTHLKLLSDNNNHIIFITECIKKHYKGICNSKVIYDGVACSSQMIFKKEKSKYFLFVGRITEGKGANILINAFMDFCKYSKQYELLIAGEPQDIKYKNKLVSLINNCDLINNVKFLGNRKDVFELMSKATALVVPSVSEAFGRITVEAMFNGCLVIGNRTAGTQEILEPENLGLLYKGQDELTKRMVDISTNGIEYYFPVIEKAQKRALELYSQEKSAEKIYDYYKEILNGTTNNRK